MKKLAAMLLTMAIIVTTCLLTAFAAGGMQDGIEMELTTDKTVYTADESVTATLTVTNTNDFSVRNVALESLVPEGYQLAPDSEAVKQIEVLNAKESVALNVTYIRNRTEDNENNRSETDVQNPNGNVQNTEGSVQNPNGNVQNTESNVQNPGETAQNGQGNTEGNVSVAASPKTGDDGNIVPYIALLVLSGAGITTLLLSGKRKRRTILSILLCTCVLVPMAAAALPAYAAELETVSRTAEVSTVVRIDDKEVTLGAKVSYTLPESSEPGNGEDNDNTEEGRNVLVAYFSATNTTKRLAEYLADGIDAELYEIVPEIPYTSADLNYGDSSSRASIEMNDPNARPAITGSVEHMSQYDIVFIGYPIWWGEAPRIINTFLESYDFSGKIIVPFCTSGSSGIGSSATNLHSLTAGADWLDGHRFGGSTSSDTIVDWANGLGLDLGK